MSWGARAGIGQHRIDQTPEMIYRLLRENGAPCLCHVMGNGELDGRDLPWQEAVDGVLAYPFGRFISCIPGKLGFFQDEDQSERYILKR